MIILLNGTSSAGKTTIGKIMQDNCEEILLLYGVDIMVQLAFPEKCDNPPLNEKAIKLIEKEVDGEKKVELVVSSYMHPVYRAAVEFYRMLSNKGYNIIVDEVLFDEKRVGFYFDILSDELVYFIGIKPDKKEVIRREETRGDRIIGLAGGLYDEVYNPLFTYDLELDTGKISPDEAAMKILELVNSNKEPSGFKATARNWHKN
jgi:chloramphenicol 3-O phosphotransferase